MLALLLPLALAAGGHGGHDAGHDGHAARHGGHGDGATVHHRFDDVDRWVKIFDDPERAEWQQPALLVGSLGITRGTTVADVGAGTGYFLPHLADAVGPDGKVLAVDIERSLVRHMRERVRDAGLGQVEVRLGAPDDPALVGGEVDLVLLVDTYHHIDGRVEWFGRLKQSVRPGGRLAIVDFKAGELPVGPPPAHRIPKERVDAELAEAGWRKVAAPDVLPYQFVHIYELAP
jgi:SAM-dependent methyltransferase